MSSEKLEVGMLVHKVSGKTNFEGRIVSAYEIDPGEWRFDVRAEHPMFKGLVHIFSARDLAPGAYDPQDSTPDPRLSGDGASTAGHWEDAHRELLDAVMACADPELNIGGLKQGPEREVLEDVIKRHHRVHKADGPHVSTVTANPPAPTGGE